VSAKYRVRQFFRSLAAHVTPAEREWVRSVLPGPAVTLFESLPVQDQRHGLDVAQALMAREEDNADLLAAALLHDAGKAGAGLTVFHRTAVVLLQAGRRQWLESLDHKERDSWRRPFWVHQHHGELGAEMARQAGCSEMTVWLVANHHARTDSVSNEERRRLLEALQREDNTH